MKQKLTIGNFDLSEVMGGQKLLLKKATMLTQRTKLLDVFFWYNCNILRATGVKILAYEVKISHVNFCTGMPGKVTYQIW